MTKSEINEGIRVLHHPLREGINAHKYDTEAASQNQQGRDATEARKYLPRAEIHEFASQLSQRRSHGVRRSSTKEDSFAVSEYREVVRSSSSEPAVELAATTMRRNTASSPTPALAGTAKSLSARKANR